MQELLDWEAATGEGLGLPKGWAPEKMRNDAGRRLIISHDAPLAFAAGLSLNGIRAAAFVHEADLIRQQQVVQEVFRYPLPLLIYVYGASAARLFPWLGQFPGFVFSATNAQDALDAACIARRITEKALLPGIILLEGTEQEKGALALPSKGQRAAFLGAPDERIPSPTPAQEIVFGPQRRRTPRWFNLELPALLGATKNAREMSLETLSRQGFWTAHLPELIAEARQVFQATFNRSCDPVRMHGPAKAEGLALAAGRQAVALKEGLQAYSDKGKRKLALLEITQWQPFPADAVVRQAKTLTILEDAAAAGQGFASWVRQRMGGTSGTEFLQGMVTGTPGTEQAAQVFFNMDKGGRQQDRFVLGAAFGGNTSGSPQHEVLLQSIRRAYPGMEQSVLGLQEKPVSIGAVKTSRFVRRYKDAGPSYSKLTHFAQHTGYFYQAGAAEQLGADPFQALPMMPAATAALANWGPARKEMLQINLGKLKTGEGCTLVCPHGAMPSLALSVEALLRGGMDISGKRGAPLTSLTPLVKNLAKGISRAISAEQRSVIALKPAILEAFDQLAGQMGLQGDKLEQAQQDVGQLANLLEPWPAVATNALFHEPEAKEAGTGLLYSLLTDPYASNGCSVCAAACPEVLEMVPVSETLLQRELAIYELWEQMPDTADADLERLIQSGTVNPLEAICWSKKRYQTMVGGLPSEKEAASRALVQATLSAVQHVLLEKQLAQEKRIREIIDQLSARIHTTLSDALPKKEFTELADALSQMQGDKTPLDVLFAGMGENAHLKKIDAAVLRRQVDLLKQLQDLQWLLREGPSGAGRALFSLLVAGKAPAWLGQYPYNHFTVPVLLAQGAVHGWASGLMEGQIRHALDNIRLLRRGALEMQGKYQPADHDAGLAALSWEDLSAEEKQSIPPLFVWSFGPLQKAQGLLYKDRPFKVVETDNADHTGSGALVKSRMNLWAVLGSRCPAAARISLSHPEAFLSAIQRQLQDCGPGLVQVHAPEAPGMDILSASRLAVQTRAFPLVDFDPEKATLQEQISLEQNPAPGALWEDTGLRLPEEAGGATYALSYADWLRVLPSWSGHFDAYTPERGAPVSVPVYLSLEPKDQKGKVPVVLQADAEKAGVSLWIPSSEALALCQAALQQWQALQEMTTGNSVFPAEAWEKREAELAAQHEAQLKQAQEEFERRLQAEQARWMAQAKERLRDNLVTLTKMNR